MTGPEHYATAEICIEQAGIESGDGNEEGARGFLMAAQVHATLSLAAATALNDNNPNGEGMRHPDWNAWIDVAGTEAQL